MMGKDIEKGEIARAPLELRGAMTGARVLVVDDDRPTLTMLEITMSRLGHLCETADDPEEALARFEGKPDQFDLVLTDYEMPNMNGNELTRRIRDIRPDIAVYVCSGLPDEKRASEAVRLGARGFLSKPIEHWRLISMLDRALATDLDA